MLCKSLYDNEEEKKLSRHSSITTAEELKNKLFNEHIFYIKVNKANIFLKIKHQFKLRCSFFC